MKGELITPSHGNIFRFLEKLRKEARTRDQMVEGLIGNDPTRVEPINPQLRARNTRILNLVLDFENPQRTRLQYLRAIGRNFNLQFCLFVYVKLFFQICPFLFIFQHFLTFFQVENCQKVSFLFTSLKYVKYKYFQLFIYIIMTA